MSYTLTQTQNWIAGFIQGLPTSNFTGSEPILSTASMVQSMVCAPPFSWAWNRAEDSSVTTTQNQQDYTINLANFGFLEKASLTESTGKIWEVKEILNSEPLAKSTTQSRPMSISVISTVPGTSAKFRLGAVPDAVYTLNLVYQKSPAIFSSLSNNWTLPDSMIQVYNNLVLGEMFALADDPRAQLYRQRGALGLLSFASGLDEEDKATFMQMYLNQGATVQASGMYRQQGISARAA